MRISRKDKKKLKAIILCYTNNPKARKTKYSKKQWIEIKKEFIVWFRVISLQERKNANTVR